ncbi:MAG: HAMP domain-containing sensor histidine kinase [Bacteroidota bacterium]
MNWNALEKDEYVTKVLEIAGLGTFHANLKGENIFVNREWEKIFGISGQEGLGLGWTSVVVAEDLLLIEALILSAMFNYEETNDHTLRIIHPEKGLRYLKASFKTFRDDEDYFIGYVQDITDAKNIEMELQEANKKLETINQEKDRMMKVLAHDLKSPIEGICVLTSIMLEDMKHPPATSEMLQLIHDSCSYSTAMIRDLIEATLNNHPETIQKKRVDLQLLVKQCVKLLNFKAEEKCQKLCLKEEEKIIAFADPEKISRVMYNLISNAIKFSPPGATVGIEVSEHKKIVRLSVKDQGIGIPEVLKNKIFDMFSEAKRFGTANETPFGLGLSICKKIVESHDGKIWFDSSEGEGSHFHVDLPR